MKRVLISTEVIEKGSYIVEVNYYDNDDIIVNVLDFETRDLLGFIDIIEEAEEGFNFNLN